MKSFDLKKALAGEPVVTRGGQKVIICGYNEGSGRYKITGWVGDEPYIWMENGKHISNECDSYLDLFMAE